MSQTKFTKYEYIKKLNKYETVQKINEISININVTDIIDKKNLVASWFSYLNTVYTADTRYKTWRWPNDLPETN